MQIGFPTDVKHVAHIGWDGPGAANNNNNNAGGAPSWVSLATLSVIGIKHIKCLSFMSASLSIWRQEDNSTVTVDIVA